MIAKKFLRYMPAPLIAPAIRLRARLWASMGAGRILGSSFGNGPLRIAIYDEETDTIRFPTGVKEVLDCVRSGMMADAVPWIRAAESFVPRGGIVFDVGGCRGITAQWFAHRAAHVHVFEPLPENAESIRRALAVRGIRNITLHTFALSDREGEAPLHVLEGQGHCSLGPVKTSRRLRKISVRTERLEAVAEKLAVERIDFLKIDVEGFEYEVLKGAESMLAEKRIGGLFFEHNASMLSDLGRSVTDVFDLLTGLGYRVLHLDGTEATRPDFASTIADFRAVPGA